MLKYTIQPGQHASRPLLLRWKWKPKRYFFSVRFLQAAYDHGNADQMDWNKLLGVSFHLFTNHENSFMLGWRWNVDTQLFEINAYQHVDGSTKYTDTLFTVPHDSWLQGVANIDYRRDQVRLSVKVAHGVAVEHVFQFSRLRKLTREINAWFGGNLPAPYYIVIEKETKIK